jgi:hypothetical protein
MQICVCVVDPYSHSTYSHTFLKLLPAPPCIFTIICFFSHFVQSNAGGTDNHTINFTSNKLSRLADNSKRSCKKIALGRECNIISTTYRSSFHGQSTKWTKIPTWTANEKQHSTNVIVMWHANMYKIMNDRTPWIYNGLITLIHTPV